ncbi:MAG TPA: hypothetical protein VHA06_04460 [Candidatus Angelobacter sp.]|jgi:hypothetical protein|nr:hypothetical protein [Candidatus Angelobacter sp.]
MNQQSSNDGPISEKDARGMAARIVFGDALTLVGMLALCLLAGHFGEPNARIRHFYLAFYLAWTLFMVIKVGVGRKPFPLKERFFFLLISAFATLSYFIQVLLNSMKGKSPFLSLIIGACCLVIAAYQFFIFSSKDLREIA